MNRPLYQKALKEKMIAKGVKCDIKIGVKKVQLVKHDYNNKDPVYALHIFCARKDKLTVSKVVDEIYDISALNATLPEAVKAYAVPDVADDESDAQAKGLEDATELMAHHKAITDSLVSMEVTDFKDLYGHRIGGNGMNLQELLMSIKHPSCEDSTNVHCLFQYVGPFAEDPTKHNIVVECDDQQLAKGLIKTLYFSILESYDETTASHWLTEKAIQTAKASYKKVNGNYVSVLQNHMAKLSGAIKNSGVNCHSEAREIKVEMVKENLPQPKTMAPCLISNLELLNGFPTSTVSGKRKIINTNSSVAAHSLIASECSVGQFSLDSNSNASPKTAEDASVAGHSIMGDATIADSTVNSEHAAPSIMGDASLAESTVASKVGQLSIGADLSLAHTEDEDMEEDPEDEEEEVQTTQVFVDLSAMEEDHKSEDEKEVEDEDTEEDTEEDATAMEDNSVHSGGQNGLSTVFKPINTVCFCDMHKEGERLCGRDRPITHLCGNTYTCLNALHEDCCKTAGLTGTDKAKVFCSETCKAVWKEILKVKTPTKPKWETITDRTRNKVVKAFAKENNVPLTSAVEKLVIFTLMVHVKHKAKTLQAFIPKLRAEKFYSRALAAVEKHAQSTTKDKLLECINRIWPPDPPPTIQPREETNQDKSGNPQHNNTQQGAGGLT